MQESDFADGTPLTTEPFTRAAARALASRPTVESEWGRMGDLRGLFGITRSLAYILAEQGHIKTLALRQKGNARGIRLVSIPSVRAYLNKLARAEGGGQP